MKTIDHGSFLRQAFSSTEEERNSTEAIAINKERPRSIGLVVDSGPTLGSAAIRDVFFSLRSYLNGIDHG